MSTVIKELDELILLLEAQIPANPQSPKNQKLSKRLEKSLAEYFNKLGQAFPYSRLDKIYNKYVIKESLGKETENILDPFLRLIAGTYSTKINGLLAEIYIAGQAEMITWGKTKAGVPIAYEGPPVSQAIAWADKHGATLVTQMDATTKQRLANTIARGIENKRGIPGLARDIKKEFSDMSRYRSQLIAQNETSHALSQASLDNMEAMGIEGKESVSVGDDRVSDECRANEGQGVIPVGQAFQSGHTRPPFHIACRCALAPAILRK